MAMPPQSERKVSANVHSQQQSNACSAAPDLRSTAYTMNHSSLILTISLPRLASKAEHSPSELYNRHVDNATVTLHAAALLAGD